MKETASPPDPVRYREVRLLPAEGRNQRVTQVRIVETTGPIPEGCEPTTEAVRDWENE